MDIALNYVEAGEGFPLVLLHGNGEDHTYFKHQMGPFSDRYRVIALDTRGHGRSPRGTAPFTLDQFAQDLKDFLDEKGIERCHLLGFSDGGNIALLFALRHPQYVEKLVVNGANLVPSGVKASTQWLITAGWVTCRALACFSQKARRNWELLNLMVTQPNIDPRALKALSMPVLVTAGEEDHTRAIAAAIPGSRLAILPGDHFVARQNWQAFNPLVLDFLAGGKEAVP